MKLPDSVIEAPRLALITGARGGVGKALAMALDRSGWATLRVDVLAEAEDAVFAQPTAYVRADASDDMLMGELGAAITREREAFLGVAAAGVISVARTEDLFREEWDRIIRINLTGVFVTLRNMIGAARAASVGRLIAISSDAGKSGEAWLPHYSASKFGVIGLVQAMALELANDGVTVNAICPSIVDTPMMQQLAEAMAEAVGEGTVTQWRERFVAEVPAGRACGPTDITFVVEMLARPESAFITGQSINVSGGKVRH